MSEVFEEIDGDLEAEQRSRGEYLLFGIDLVMIGLLLLNLGFIVFDLLFESPFFQYQLGRAFPDFYSWYATEIHPDFLAYDLVFIAIFATELLVRWAFAIANETYHRWFFYPFVHWYDVLGLVPFGSLRALRFFRLFSVLKRMQTLGVFDIRQTFMWGILRKYYLIVVEEVSDRVVINVLDSVKDEVRSGSPLSDEIITQIVVPHKDELVQLLSDRIQLATENVYQERKDDIQNYVQSLVAEAMVDNKELKNLATYLPFGGKIISNMITTATKDIVFKVINGMAGDLASAENKVFVDEIADIAIEVALMREEGETLPGEANSDVVTKITLSVIELIQERVAIQQWKLREQQERRSREHQRRQKEFDEIGEEDPIS